MPKIRPYSRPKALEQIDGRTREGKLLKRKRAELLQHVGSNPSATQRALVDRAAWLFLHVALIDERTATGKPMTEFDSRQYLAWSNALVRLMRQIGLKPGSAIPTRTLAEHLAERAAASAAA